MTNKKTKKAETPKKKIVILFGPPGAGKGTQASLLAEKMSLYYFETSKIIEANVLKAQKNEFVSVAGKKYFLKDEKRLWKTGILNTPEVVTFWVKKRINEIFKMGESLVLAGSPRTLYEGRALLPLLKKLYGKENIKTVSIKLSAERSIFRNSHRRICELMRHPIIYNEETNRLTKCPLDGSKLMKREGLDDPETIKVRLKEYEERTYPLIKYFKGQGLKVKEISGSGSVAEVFNEILKTLK